MSHTRAGAVQYAVQQIKALGLPAEGPVLVTLQLEVEVNESNLPAEAVTAFIDQLERVAPGRVCLVVLGPEATVASLDDADLATLGLVRSV